MPPQTQKSPLWQRLGERAIRAWDHHKGEEIRWGAEQLPNGIVGGIARIVLVQEGEFKAGTPMAGHPFVTIQGTAITPVEFKTVKVQGKRVSNTIPLCDTPSRTIPGSFGQLEGTLENWVMYLMDEFRKLEIDVGPGMQYLENYISALMQLKPCTRFSTNGYTPKPTATNPSPQEMVFVQFDGKCLPPANMGDGTVDNTGKGVSPNGAVSHIQPQQVNRLANTAVSQPEPHIEYNDQSDMDSLALRADPPMSEKDAQDTLEEMARKAGIAQEAINDAPSYATVVEMMRKPSPHQKATPVAEPIVPKVDEIYNYLPTDGKTGVKATKSVEVKIVDVNLSAKTCTIKLVDNQKVRYKNVPFGELE